MVGCDIHRGYVFTAPCCHHIQDAVLETRERLPAFVVIDGMGDPNYVCTECYERAKAWLEEYAAGSATPEPEFSDTGTCGKCMRDWYLETGLGDRSAAVKAARAERADIEARRCAARAAQHTEKQRERG